MKNDFLISYFVNKFISLILYFFNFIKTELKDILNYFHIPISSDKNHFDEDYLWTMIILIWKNKTEFVVLTKKFKNFKHKFKAQKKNY